MLYIKKVNEEETTFHTFKCTACNEVYQLNGIETKAKCRRALVKKIQTIHSQTTSVKFTCPHCHSNVYQERIFDINMTKFSGNIRIQMDQRAPDPQKRTLLNDLLLKDVAPVLVMVFLMKLLVR